MSIKIAIIGCSIAGMASSIVLKRMGYDVRVFERFTKSQMDQKEGGGLSVDPSLLDRLYKTGLVKNMIPFVPIKSFDNYWGPDYQFVSKTPNVYCSLVMWRSLYDALGTVFDHSLCRYGTNVHGFQRLADGSIALNTDHGTEFFDFIFFADGYKSIGRQILFPRVERSFSGYVAWRGLAHMHKDATGSRIFPAAHRPTYNGRHSRYFFPRGYILAYPVRERAGPYQDPDDYPYLDYGQYDYINWVLYETVSPDPHLPLFFEHPSVRHRETFQPGDLPFSYEVYLRALVQKVFKGVPLQFVSGTQKPYLQFITDVFIPQYTQGRVCLIGDASSFIRPHTAINTTKALDDAMALEEYLRPLVSPSPDALEKALSAWGIDRPKLIGEVYYTSQVLGDVFVKHITQDVSTITEEKLQKLWDECTRSAKNKWYALEKSLKRLSGFKL